MHTLVRKWMFLFRKMRQAAIHHDRHKENYILMFNSGLLYNLTGNKQYALLVRNILLKYAALNPTLKKHPQATSSSPGHIFWQALNDANWLVYTGLGL
jgi:VanZ family protein